MFMTIMIAIIILSSVVNTIAEEESCRGNYGSNCHMNTTKQCAPYSVSAERRCAFIECCCGDEIEDRLMDYLNFEYCNNWGASNIQPEVMNTILLIIITIHYFMILGNIADDYFALIMSETADTLHISHNIAGVTLLAFGNGAPDIASSVAAIQQGGEQIKLGIGALLGAAVFNPIFISAVIATYAVNKPPEVARRPFVRDCIFLFLAATIVLVITIRGTVDIYEAISMVLLYLVYVFSAVLTEIYNKLRKKRKKTSDKQRKNKKSLKDKIIMPALGLFSNESMRELNIPCTNSYQSFGGLTKQLSTISLAPVPVMITNDDDETDDDDDSDSGSMDETMSDIVSDLLIEQSEKNSRRHWSIKIVLFILSIPIKFINYICKLTIPLTDNKRWNDRIAMMSCIFSPLWILFSFGIFHTEIGIFEMWHIGLIFGIIMFLFTFYFIQKKYKYKLNTNERNESEIELTISSSNTFTFTSYTINSEGIRGNETTQKRENNNMRQENVAVMKYFFLFLGFLSSISWIILIANELVSILT
eukprot:487769_1